MGSMGRQRRKFTPEYRRDAAHLVIDTGRTIKAVADEIRVSEQLLGKWVRAERQAMGPVSGPALSEGERAELERLRAEVVQLRMDNEFLGKASAYFASRTVPRTSGR